MGIMMKDKMKTNMSNKRKVGFKQITKMMAVAGAALMMVGCATNSNATKSGNEATGSTVKIGMNMELSGAAAGYGNQMKKGFELAVNEINAAGGIKVGDKKMKIEPVILDNKSTTSGAASVAAQLATKEKVSAIVGTATTSAGTAAIPAITKAKVAAVSPSATDPNFTLQKDGTVQPYVFRACFENNFQGKTAAHYVNDQKSIKKVAIIADNSSDYGTGLAKAFKGEVNAKVVSTQYFAEGDKDFNALVTSIKSQDIDAIYAPGYYSEVGLIIKQARQSGIDVPIIGSDGMADPKLAEIAGDENASNVFYTTPFSTMSANSNDVAKKFITNYEKKYDQTAPTFSALAYDSVLMIKQAIENGKSTNSVKIAKELAKIKDMPAAAGDITVNKNHDPEKPIIIEELQKGKVAKATVVK